MNIQKRVIDVISSCRRKEQLEVAIRYAQLAIKKYPREDFSRIKEVVDQKQDEIRNLSN